MRHVAIALLGLLFFAVTHARETVHFASDDGLQVTADRYVTNEERAPFIILFHRAGWSRGEYREIAPKLNAMGFNCLAVDQRSGKAVNGVVNETAAGAEKAGKPATYLDALSDMKAAIKFVRQSFPQSPLIIWGSSYSAALVLKIAGEHPDWIDGVLAFAPGEYFQRLGKPEDFIRRSAAGIKDPVFITSARSEEGRWRPIWEVISSPKSDFVPKSEGVHGSEALWESTPEHQAYWDAVRPFLQQFLEE